jgi:hypothetical protein
VGSYPSRPPTPSPPPKESGVSGSCVDGLGCARGERLGTRTQCGVVWDRTDEDVWRAYWVEERGWGCGLEGRAGRAGKWVWVGSWGSRVNDVGRRYPTFRAALRAWAFRDRRSSGRWRRLCVCVCVCVFSASPWVCVCVCVWTVMRVPKRPTCEEKAVCVHGVCKWCVYMVCMCGVCVWCKV